MSPLPKPSRPLLCYVTDRRSLPLATSADAQRLLLENIVRVAEAGVDWIQLREKDYNGQEWSSLLGESLQRVRAAGWSTRLLVNDRLDVALGCGADGIHISENGIPVADARRLRDDYFLAHGTRDFLIGVSCHSLGAALGAARGGADYIFFSPIYFTPSKANYGPPQGLERLARICSAVDIPVLAIGGITVDNAQECLDAGASGVAAIRLFQDSSGQLAQIVGSLRHANGEDLLNRVP